MGRLTDFLKLYLPAENDAYNEEKDQNANFEKIDKKIESMDKNFLPKGTYDGNASELKALLEKEDKDIKDNRWRLYSKEIGNDVTETDLDTITDIGWYHSMFVVNKFRNNPNSYGAFTLKVESIQPNNKDYLRQTLFSYANYKIFCRYKAGYGNAWTSWATVGDNLDTKWDISKIGEFKGLSSNGSGIFFGSGNELNFDVSTTSSNTSFIFNYRPTRDGRKIDHFRFHGGDGAGATYAKITAGDIVSNGSLVLTEKYCPYNVGDIYETTNTTNPATRWVGTTWQKIEGRFLRATSGSESAGTTGGSDSKTLSVENLASHTHTQSAHTHTQPAHTHTMKVERSGEGGWRDGQRVANGDNFETNMVWKTDPAGGENTGGAQPAIQSTGSGKAFDIKPAYYTVHIWKRLS